MGGVRSVINPNAVGKERPRPQGDDVTPMSECGGGCSECEETCSDGGGLRKLLVFRTLNGSFVCRRETDTHGESSGPPRLSSVILFFFYDTWLFYFMCIPLSCEVGIPERFLFLLLLLARDFRE